MECIICLEIGHKKNLFWHLHLSIIFKNFFMDQQRLHNTMVLLWTLLDERKKLLLQIYLHKVSCLEGCYANIANTAKV